MNVPDSRSILRIHVDDALILTSSLSGKTSSWRINERGIQFRQRIIIIIMEGARLHRCSITFIYFFSRPFFMSYRNYLGHWRTCLDIFDVCDATPIGRNSARKLLRLISPLPPLPRRSSVPRAHHGSHDLDLKFRPKMVKRGGRGLR